jgi:hypothetical protein
MGIIIHFDTPIGAKVFMFVCALYPVSEKSIPRAGWSPVISDTNSADNITFIKIHKRIVSMNRNIGFIP